MTWRCHVSILHFLYDNLQVNVFGYLYFNGAVLIEKLAETVNPITFVSKKII